MNYQETLSYIHGFKRFGKPGLSRVTELLELLGRPQEGLPIVHVAGTNGKGSTTVMIARILQDSGYKVASFTSPYVVDFRERMQINGEMISKEELCRLFSMVKEKVDWMESQGRPITEFEVVTAAALYWFKEQACDIVVLEVGLGGRFDATNAIGKPLVSVITAIGMDHTEILGSTLTDIAFEKCGIMKEGGITVTYPLQEKEALILIQKQAAIKHNRLVVSSMSKIAVQAVTQKGSDLTYQGVPIHLPLVGEHQLANLVTALCVIEELKNQQFKINTENIANGIKNVHIPARMEVIHQSPTVILDGAHNLSGATALAQALKKMGKQNIVAITGMLEDKDYEGILRVISPYCKEILTVTPESPRSVPAEKLAQSAEKYCAAVSAHSTMTQAYETALSHTPEEETILIFGSLYLASEMRKVVLSPEFDQ